MWLAALVMTAGGGLATPPVARAQERNSAQTNMGSGFSAPVPSRSASSQLEWIFFPVNPPALGAEVAVVAASRQIGTPTALRAFLTDPFFTPLATRIVQVESEPARPRVFETEEFVRLDSFLQIRAALVGELYDRCDPIMQLEPGARLAAFAALAQSQEPRLAELEATAEWLRDRLSRTEPWGEHRRWRLNRGGMRQPRDKTFVLEFQVVRAAAYYQPGFSPAQRRLIRELTIEMSETIATKGQSDGSGLFMFFSPETTRIMRPQSMPAELESMIEHYLAEKRRLKDELREIIYETDGILLELTRTRRIADLAEAQAAAIHGLEDMAEKIRREVTMLPDYRRFRGVTRLSARLEERLQAFAQNVQQIASDRAAFIRQRVEKARREVSADRSGQVTYESAARARAIFEMEQGNRLMEHERTAEALLSDLIEELPPEEVGRLNGTADIAIRDYLERRAELDAYADYDLAALEPGLSPAQRRLLLAAAMARLRQVMLPPELQPTEPPGTLLGIGG